jgi:hypothetical protein
MLKPSHHGKHGEDEGRDGAVKRNIIAEMRKPPMFCKISRRALFGSRTVGTGRT